MKLQAIVFSSLIALTSAASAEFFDGFDNGSGYGNGYGATVMATPICTAIATATARVMSMAGVVQR